jgi:hypothetical protein
MADFRAGGAETFPRRFLGALDQTAIGGTILPPRATVDLMDVVEPHAAEALADARHRVQQLQGLGVMGLGRFADGAFDVAPQRIVGGDERESHCDALVHHRIGQALGDPIAVGFVGDRFAEGGEGILAGGIVHRGQELTAFAGQVQAPTQQVAGRAPRGGIDIGLREPPAAPQHSACMGLDLVVFGLAAMDRFHRESMTEDKRHTLFSTEVCKPVPRQQAFGSEDDRLAVGGNGFEQRLWGRGHMTVQQRFASLVEDAHVHGAGVEIDTTVKRVLFRVKSPEVSSSL